MKAYKLTGGDLGRDKIKEAAEKINASQEASGEWVYYATETSETWRVSDNDLLELYALMHHADDDIRRDAYSHWCAAGYGEVVTVEEAT